MVERPIKKSDRQAQPKLEAGGESTAKPVSESTAKPLPVRSIDRPSRTKDTAQEPGKDQGDRDRDKSKGRGKGKSRDEEPRQVMNPALLRGPKPARPKPPEPEVEETPSEAAEDAVVAEDAIITEEIQEATVASETA